MDPILISNQSKSTVSAIAFIIPTVLFRRWVLVFTKKRQASTIEVSTEISGNEQEPVEVPWSPNWAVILLDDLQVACYLFACWVHFC